LAHAVCHGCSFIQFRVGGWTPNVDDVEIRKADLSKPVVADAWHQVYDASLRFERPFSTPWLRPEIEEQFRSNLRRESSAWEGLVDGRVVCVGTIEMPLLDNVLFAGLGVYTDPASLRRGHGSQMLAHLEDLVVRAGRRKAYVETEYPIDATTDGTGFAGPEFARARGYTFALGDVMRSQPLPVASERLDALAALAADFHGDYRVQAFEGSVPEEWVADYVALEGRINSDAPSGTLELEAGSAAVEPFREGEERTKRQDRSSYMAVALHGDRVVAFTKITVARSDPALGYQWGTLVATEHRGHRLGLAVKVANLRQLQVREPELRSIITWNAEVNEPMIAVNELLGYVAVQRGGGFEKRW